LNSKDVSFKAHLPSGSVDGSGFDLNYGSIINANANSPFAVGDDLLGGLTGEFYGTSSSDLLEIAGSWYWFDPNSYVSAVGVFAGSEEPDVPLDYAGKMTFASSYVNIETDSVL
ncbi:MAG: hypothetical protein AB8B77_05120, partial [Alphaproteobacteria bacterium]